MRASTIVLVLLLASVAVAGDAPDPLSLFEQPFRDLIEEAAPSVVRVGPRSSYPVLLGTPVTTIPMSRIPPSTGVALAPEWVLAHVAGSRRPDQLSVATTDGKLLSGSVKARLESPRLVLIHVPGARLSARPTGSAKELEVGEWVTMLGNAFGTGATGGPPATLGLLSARVEREGWGGTLAVSAASNPGDAGGAVLDRDGRVIGIVSGKRSLGDMTEVLPVEDVLTRLGEVKGFSTTRGTRGERTLPVDALARHIGALAGRIRPSIVSLVVTRTRAAAKRKPGPVRAGGALLPRYPIGDGIVSGFLIDDRGTIVTAYVNLSDVRGRLEGKDGKSLLASVLAILPDGRKLPAKLIGAHEAKGFAILRIDAEELPAPALGKGRDLTVGRWVLTLGDPLGIRPAGPPVVGFGIVSDHSCEPERYDAFMTDAPINTATVGGPVVDMLGRVIGISTVSVSPKDASMRYGLNSGIGFVIPIEDVLALVPRIEKEGVIRFRPGFLGVRLVEVPEADGGVRILSVTAGTGAAKGGLEAGDVILAINGIEVTDGIVLRQVLFSLGPGAKVTLAVRRGDEALNVVVELTLRPGFPR